MTVIRAIPGRIRFTVQAESQLVLLKNYLRTKLADVFNNFAWKYSKRTGRGLITFPANLLDTVTVSAELDSFFAKNHETHSLELSDTTLSLCQDKELERLPSPFWIVGKKTAVFYINRMLTPLYLRPYFLMLNVLPLIFDALKSLLNRKLNIDVLDAAAIGSAMAMRDFNTAATIHFLLDIGETLEDWTKEKSRRDLSQLFRCDEKPIWVKDGSNERIMFLDQVEVGDIVIIRSGTQIPVDGEIVEGRGLINQSSMTGEPLAVSRQQGDSVYAGTVLEEGKVLVMVQAKGDATKFAQIAQTISESDHFKAAIQSKTEELANKVVPFSFLLSGVIFALTRNWMKAGAVLMADYSCAIKLATPLTIRATMLDAAKNGALIKGGKFIEKLAEVDAVVLDKTGTLTEAQPKVANFVAFGGHGRKFILKTAACLGEHFPHPVANAIVRQAEHKQLKHHEDHEEVEYIPAHGIISSLKGERLLLGSYHFIHEDEMIDISEAKEFLDSSHNKGHSILYLALGGKLIGVFALEDPLRNSAPRFIRRLENCGIKKIILLTGDNASTASKISAHLDIEEYYSEVLPQDKHDLIVKLQEEGYKVAMIGDGINDSIALTRADIGVSMTHGADIAKETCDVMLTGERLDNFIEALVLSRKAMKTIKTNFVFIVASNTIFIAGGVLGFLPASAIALLHNLSTVGTCVRSMRSKSMI